MTGRRINRSATLIGSFSRYFTGGFETRNWTNKHPVTDEAYRFRTDSFHNTDHEQRSYQGATCRLS